ncbi:hypothetical protein sscle_10g077490 [Sclerotinia sclerotiorum 1980 UF-70]|uniref:Uncharacterized protein n=1 Tax=Sclerotinia sclerotiorum (strain ATCC 18683 / 1980 / Ss-1) TaxID=665079 RepID=A0A1D9QDM6_SCLS1|nr:hypothetical protein sscle_10g077490 [Sclerotinia sclerotiorum 1980 UF-70]
MASRGLYDMPEIRRRAPSPRHDVSIIQAMTLVSNCHDLGTMGQYHMPMNSVMPIDMTSIKGQSAGIVN